EATQERLLDLEHDRYLPDREQGQVLVVDGQRRHNSLQHYSGHVSQVSPLPRVSRTGVSLWPTPYPSETLPRCRRGPHDRRWLHYRTPPPPCDPRPPPRPPSRR